MIQLSEFSVGTIVYQTTPKKKEYGVVIKIIPDDYRPVIIRWDCEPNEPFNYTLDEIQVLKIQTVPQFQPNITLIELKSNQPLQLKNNQLIILMNTTQCIVKFLEEDILTLQEINSKTLYEFEFNNFNTIGKIVGHLIFPTPKQQEPKIVSEFGLSLEIKYWLEQLTLSSELLITLSSNQNKQLLKQFITHLQTHNTEHYIIEELEKVWTNTLTEFIQNQLNTKGIYNFIINAQVWQKTTKTLGEVVNITPSLITIEWEKNIIDNYTYLELKALNIVPIQFIQLSHQVAYEYSCDGGSYFQAYIGFKTKKLAKLWLYQIKEILGKLSCLNKCETQEQQHLAPLNWEYTVERFKHKTITRKIEDIQQIAQLNLQDPPEKANAFFLKI